MQRKNKSVGAIALSILTISNGKWNLELKRVTV